MKQELFNTENTEAAEKSSACICSAISAVSALRFFLPFLAAGALFAGCQPCPDEVIDIDQIVAAHNANAAQIPRLWARAEMDVTVKPPDAPEMTWRSGSPTCLLLYWRGGNPDGPHDFVLVGRETAAVELFRMGSSTDQGLYYFWYRFGDRGGAWFGRLALAGAPGVSLLPFDPTELLGVLGITPLPANPGRLPAAVLTMNDRPGECSYVVGVVDAQPVSGRVLVKREIILPWSNDEPPLPKRVNLLDAAGRRVMTATLSDYRPIDTGEDQGDADDAARREQPPVMPTSIDIVWRDVPGQPSRLIRRIHLKLSKMTAEDNELEADLATAFRPPPGVRPVPVDKGVGEGPTSKRGEP